jgi:hypothetical protein
MEKTCTKCKKIRQVSAFSKDAGASDGFHRWCKSCCKIARQVSYLKNRTHELSTNKEYVAKNKEHLKERRRNHYHSNKDKFKQKRSDLTFRLQRNVRMRLKKALHNKRKIDSIIALMGCSVNELKQYLSFFFKEGMTWDNYGTVWEIDHIQPISCFDLSIEVNQYLCSHYSNLQPLFISENRSKKDKYVG